MQTRINMQNLAYLGEDGDVQHANNGMLGAIRPMNLLSKSEAIKKLQNALDNAQLSEKEQRWLNRRHPNLNKNHQMLQNLGYIGQDGNYHGNEMLSQRLMDLAYLGEDGEVRHGGEGRLGSFAPMNLSEDDEDESVLEAESVDSLG